MKFAANGTKLNNIDLWVWAPGALAASDVRLFWSSWLGESIAQTANRRELVEEMRTSDMLLLQVLEQLFPLPVAWAGGIWMPPQVSNKKWSTLLVAAPKPAPAEATTTCCPACYGENSWDADVMWNLLGTRMSSSPSSIASTATKPGMFKGGT